jgi:hypothetical protein
MALANVKYIHAIHNERLLEPGHSSPEIIITINKNGSFHATVVSILKRDGERDQISSTLDTDWEWFDDDNDQQTFSTDVQTMRELYRMSQLRLGELRDRAIQEPYQKEFWEDPKPAEGGLFGGSKPKLAAWIPHIESNVLL